MKNLEELKNKDKIKEILDTTEIFKSKRLIKNLKRILIFSTFRENTTQRFCKCNNKRSKICDIIIEGISYTFKTPETKLKINKDLSCNSKYAVYIIECGNCKEIYIGSTQALNTRTSLPWMVYCLLVWFLWHINLCRLFNAQSIFMKIILFQTIQFSIIT